MLSFILETAAVGLYIVSMIAVLIFMVKKLADFSDMLIDMWEPSSFIGKHMKTILKWFVKLSVMIPGFPGLPLMYIATNANAFGF